MHRVSASRDFSERNVGDGVAVDTVAIAAAPLQPLRPLRPLPLLPLLLLVDRVFVSSSKP